MPGTFPEGMGEPLNAILSGHSDSAVLVDQQTDGGLRNYWEHVASRFVFFNNITNSFPGQLAFRENAWDRLVNCSNQ